MVSDLTGLPVANASLLDESTAAAEAMIMAKRVSKSNSNKFFVDKFTHSQNIAVMKTRAEPLHINIVIGHPDEILDDNQYFCAIFQYPGTFVDIRYFSNHIS